MRVRNALSNVHAIARASQTRQIHTRMNASTSSPVRFDGEKGPLIAVHETSHIVAGLRSGASSHSAIRLVVGQADVERRDAADRADALDFAIRIEINAATARKQLAIAL